MIRAHRKDALHMSDETDEILIALRQKNAELGADAMTNDEVEKAAKEIEIYGYCFPGLTDQRRWREYAALLRRLRDERDEALAQVAKQRLDIVDLGFMVGEARNKALDEAAALCMQNPLFDNFSTAILDLKTQEPKP
jgi:hypothetical protein